MPVQSKNDGFQPKWRVFHPQSTVWIINPFEHDVEFEVADEHNNPYQYRLPAGKTCELPGGAVATLGVKAIVDEMIQSDPKDVYSLWETGVRERYEAKIILRVKEAARMTATEDGGGVVNLSVPEDDVATDQEDEVEHVSTDIEKPVFPTRKKAATPDFAGLAGKKDVEIKE